MGSVSIATARYPEVGETVRIDGVDHVIVNFLPATMEYVTESGHSFFELDLKPFGDYHLTSIDDVEEFLAAPDWCVLSPKGVEKIQVVRCQGRVDCGCRWCYHEFGLDEHGAIVTRHHFVDSQSQCHCNKPTSVSHPGGAGTITKDCGCR